MIQINYRDTRPFYQQIKDNVRHLVVSGALKKDDKLPSVRELAASLAINPNTIQRAYRELENEGYIYTLPGKGTFAAEMDHTNQIRQQELLPQFDKIVSELLYLSMHSRIVSFPSQEGGFRHDTGRTYYKNIPWI